MCFVFSLPHSKRTIFKQIFIFFETFNFFFEQESLTKNFLWIRTLGSTPVLLEGEYVEQYPERVNALAEKIRVVSSAAPERRRIAAGKEKESNELDNICQGVVELASEKIQGNIVQVAKKNLFCDCSTRFNNIFNIINK